MSSHLVSRLLSVIRAITCAILWHHSYARVLYNESHSRPLVSDLSNASRGCDDGGAWFVRAEDAGIGGCGCGCVVELRLRLLV